MIVQICVGSSCHLKGSEKIVELFQKAISDNKLDAEISLSGSFCTGQCNRTGVTIIVNDKTITGVTPESFDTFFKDTILKELEIERS